MDEIRGRNLKTISIGPNKTVMPLLATRNSHGALWLNSNGVCIPPKPRSIYIHRQQALIEPQAAMVQALTDAKSGTDDDQRPAQVIIPSILPVSVRLFLHAAEKSRLNAPRHRSAQSVRHGFRAKLKTAFLQGGVPEEFPAHPLCRGSLSVRLRWMSMLDTRVAEPAALNAPARV